MAVGQFYCFEKTVDVGSVAGGATMERDIRFVSVDQFDRPGRCFGSQRIMTAQQFQSDRTLAQAAVKQGLQFGVAGIGVFYRVLRSHVLNAGDVQSGAEVAGQVPGAIYRSCHVKRGCHSSQCQHLVSIAPADPVGKVGVNVDDPRDDMLIGQVEYFASQAWVQVGSGFDDFSVRNSHIQQIFPVGGIVDDCSAPEQDVILVGHVKLLLFKVFVKGHWVLFINGFCLGRQSLARRGHSPEKPHRRCRINCRPDRYDSG